MKKLLFQLDTDAIPNTFDIVVAYDAGADHVVPLAGVTSGNVARLVEGVVFTRPPAAKKNSALFVTGSDLAAGEALLAAVRKQFFGQFRVSVMLDSNGCNTTAAAAVAVLSRDYPLAGKHAVVLAGTGPVGQRAAVMLSQAGATVTLASRQLARAEAACAAVNQRFGTQIAAAETADLAATEACVRNAEVVLTTGAAGIELLPEALWSALPRLEVVMDANSTPPLGCGGLTLNDRGVERHGKRCYGALGFGGLKLEIQRTCVARLFEANTHVLDAAEILAIAQELAAQRPA